MKTFHRFGVTLSLCVAPPRRPANSRLRKENRVSVRWRAARYWTSSADRAYVAHSIVFLLRQQVCVACSAAALGARRVLASSPRCRNARCFGKQF